MKKALFTIIFVCAMSFGVAHAKAVSLDDLLAEIMSLKTQVAELKTNLTAAVRSADAIRTTAPSAPLWMTPYIVSGPGPFSGKYIYDCNDGEFNWTLDMGDNHDRLGDHYSGNGVTCNLIVALANSLNTTRTTTTNLTIPVSTTKATTSMPSWMAPYVVTGSGPFPGRYIYTCSDGVGNKWTLDMGNDFRLGNHYDNNGIVCNIVLAVGTNLNNSRTPIISLSTPVATTKATTNSVTNTQVAKTTDSTPVQSKVSSSNGPDNPGGWWTPFPGSAYECDKFFKVCWEWASGHVGNGTPNLVPPSHNYLCPNCVFIAPQRSSLKDISFLGTDSTSMVYGETSERVKGFQQLLISLGYLAEGNDTGFYGNSTMVATKTFQNAFGIEGNGKVVGPKTQTLIRKAGQL